MDINGLSDPYCKLLILGDDNYKLASFKTTTINSTLHPIWDQGVKFLLDHPMQHVTLKFTVYDKDKLSKDDFMGTGSIQLQFEDILNAENAQEHCIQLMNKKSTKKRGMLFYKIFHTDY
eukprot:TRINITY_DN11615_c0_g1_i1.p1 TRINITY_DN11615_c0_g1~~TRINITY_DN11615_c0_g1_i1.p1  ORF type:complete len:139 (-),score=29.76 TRINITY_DN11615_c0_g1_i1:123-479(-)